MINAGNMRKLMETVAPTSKMDMADMPVDNMGAMDNNGDMREYDPNMDAEAPGMSTDIIDALEGEFKRLTTEYLQTGGELDEAGLSDVREKLGKHMTSILDVLHASWMENMMDQGDTGSEEGGDSDSDDTPTFMQSDDDSDAEETDDEATDADDSEDNSEEKDDSDDEKEYNFEEAHLNESSAKWMRRLQDKILNK